MVTSTSSDPAPPNPEPREVMLDTLAAQTAAIDELVDLAQERLQIFDVDLSQCGWQTAGRAERLAAFLRRSPGARIELIAHDLRFLETSCPRLLALLKPHSHAITVYRAGAEARSANDPLVIADGRHFLHRYHVGQPRATFVVGQPQLARPWVMRFGEIWATGEPGLGATVLGL